MRSSVIVMGSGVLGILAVLVTPATAQSVLDGPLAAPGAPTAAPPHHAKAKPKRVHHAAARPVVPAAADAPTAAPPAEPSRRVAPDDPVSLGMKWNGSNDSAAQTRYENLNGNAAGTGAEVGLKLHF